MATMTKVENERDEASGVPRPGTEVNLALVATGAIGLVMALAGLLVWDVRVAIGVAVGAAIAVANLWVFKRVGHAFLSDKGTSRALWGLVGALKFVVLLVGVGLLLRYRVVEAIPLIVGYAALPTGITLSNFFAARFQDET